MNLIEQSKLKEVLFKADHYRNIDKLSPYAPQTVEKKWGTEVILNQVPYGCKVMILGTEGSRCSLHCHKNKAETFILISGKMEVEIIDDGDREIFTLQTPFSSVTISPMVFHRFTCKKEGTVFIESSSEDLITDSYRVTQSER